MDKWNKRNVVHIYNGILALIRNETLTHASTWTNLEDIIKYEISQVYKNK